MRGPRRVAQIRSGAQSHCLDWCMEPAIRSVSGPEAWGFAEVAQVVGVIALVLVLVSLIVYGLRSDSDPRRDPYLAAQRRARRGVATDDEIEYLERFNMPSGPGGGDGSG